MVDATGDAAVRDPADPSRIAPYFDGSDHLHLNLAGYVALGNAVPLELLLDPACSRVISGVDGVLALHRTAGAAWRDDLAVGHHAPQFVLVILVRR